MLSPADAALARRDPKLSRSLTLLFDEEACVEKLGLLVPENEIKYARAVYVRYKPQTNCLVAYRLGIGSHEVDVHAKAHASDDRTKLELPEDNSRVVLKDEAIVFSVFPRDSKLKRLPKVNADASRKKMLRRLLPDRCELWSSRLSPLSYKPERRFVGRLASRHGQSKAVLKIYAHGDFHVARARAQVFTSGEVLRVPRLLGFDEHNDVLVLEWLDGVPLEQLLTQPGAAATLQRVGQALAELHEQQPTRVCLNVFESQQKPLLEIARGLAVLLPHQAPRIESLARDITASPATECSALGLLHGDFYASQVLIANDNVAVVDFDEASWGDQGSDLANFVAHLEYGAIRGRFSRHQVDESSLALLDGYRRQPQKEVRPAAIAAYTAASLFRLAHQPFRSRDRDWQAQTEAIIERAKEFLRRSQKLRFQNRGSQVSKVRVVRRRHTTTQSEAHVSDPFGAADDSAMPFLRAALNPESAQRSLLKQLGDSGPARNLELHAIRVVRHKLGRRCLIEYDVIVRRPSGAEEAMTLIGKARARGVDDRAFRLTGELRTAGFNEESHDEIVVPEPIAIVPEFQMWLQRKVSGESLTALLPTRSGINLSRRVAHLIHKLQRTTVEPARIHTIAHELGILNQRLVLLIVDRPNWRARLERVMNACVTLASTLSASPPRLAHRDFHPDQVLVNGERVYVLDFDLCAKSDPALDAGNFVAHVSELSLRMTGDPQALADREHALEESLVARDPTISRSALRAYATLTLARHIHISTQFPERQPFTENILELCERRLNVSHRTPRRALQPSFQTEGVSHANSIL